MMADEIDRQDRARISAGNSSCGDEPCGNATESEEEIVAALQRSDSSVLSRCNSISGGGDAEEPLYIAVGKEYKESKATIIWALWKKRRYKKIVLIHVHCPAKMIHVGDTWYQVGDLTAEQVEAYRLKEIVKMNQTLEDYMYICEVAKVQAEKTVVEADDVADGILQVVARHGVTKLVMGAAADKYFSKKMRSPLSKTAQTVLKEAPPSCDVWFVCKGTLICSSKEANLDWSGMSHSPTSSPRARLSQTELVRHKLMPQPCSVGNLLQDSVHMRESCNGSLDEETFAPLPKAETDGTSSRSSLSKEVPIDDLLEAEPRCSQGSDSLNSGEYVEGTPDSVPKGEGANSDSSAMMLQLVQESEEETRSSSTENQADNFEVHDEWNVCLQQVVTEAAKLINGAYRESRLRYKAEREALEANSRAKALEMKYNKEMQQREESEELLAQTKSKMEELQKLADKVQEELSEASRKNSKLQAQITESDSEVKNLEEKLSTAEQLLKYLQNERSVLKRERDRVAKEVKDMWQTGVAVRSSSSQTSNFLEISSVELKQATCNFENSLKIGEGASGCVFKGFIQQTSVAIKILHPQGSYGQAEFQKEVGILCKLRHPNLASLIGASSEERALVYEFMPNGTIEDHLSCNCKAPPLPWRTRISIIAGICSALIFLHSSKPQSIIHGDLRPANILLDSNFTSKVTDFGLTHLIDQSTLYNWNDPKGAFAYMDPEFFSTGELTARSDVYSFGITILRLLTGKPALGIVKEVQEALESNQLQTILDSTAGDWPLPVAQQMALLGLKCSEMKRKNRADLVKHAWKILEPFKVLSSQ